MYPENDNQFKEVIITNVQKETCGWSISGNDGFGFYVLDDSPVVPEVGMVARFYGKGVGSIVRGLFLNGNKVFYCTEEDQFDIFAQ